MEKLKPCPFCGAKVAYCGTVAGIKLMDDDYPDYEWAKDHYAVVCNYNEGGCGSATRGYATVEKAVEAWVRGAVMEKNIKYNEIKELYKYCVKLGINAVFENLHDGYVIRFPNGGDFIQHRFSYGNYYGCVEPAIGSRVDYTAVSLRNAKALVKRHKDKLNRPKEDV